MGKAVTITDANFEELVINSKTPVLVDFWAEWCGPCKAVGPIVENIAGDFEGRAVVGKVDVDSNPIVARRFGVRSIPTLLYFKEGQEKDKQVGLTDQKTLADKLQKLL